MAKKRIATFLGPNLGLSIAGDHFFAYSGPIVASTTLNTVLSFTTGNYTCVGTAQLSPYMVDSTLTDQLQAGAQISLNGSIIAYITTGSSTERAGNYAAQTIVIPPYTKVKVEVDAPADEGSYHGSFTMTGRVYDV